MAYYRTLKNGERRLIYTAKDKQVREQRDRLRFQCMPSEFDNARVRDSWRDIRYVVKHSYDSYSCRTRAEKLQEILAGIADYEEYERKWREDIYAWIRKRHTGKWVDRHIPASYYPTCKLRLAEIQAHLRFLRTIARNWNTIY